MKVKTIKATVVSSYSSWKKMKRRCLDIGRPEFKYYGGRGIKICDRWLGKNGFYNFYKDMGERKSGLSLDRINNDGNYEPKNCRWATRLEQTLNRAYTIKEDKILIIKDLISKGLSTKEIQRIVKVSSGSISNIRRKK